MQNPEEVWQAMLLVIGPQVSVPDFETWIKPVKLILLDGDKLIIQVESDYHRDWILKHHKQVILHAVELVLNRSVMLEICVQSPDYNNYNLNKSRSSLDQVDSRELQDSENLKNYKNYRGLFRKIHSDSLFKMAQGWGVDPKMIYSCVKAYGEERVKNVIHRIGPDVLADSYFRQGQPISQQRGRLFTAEMKKLRAQKAG